MILIKQKLSENSSHWLFLTLGYIENHRSMEWNWTRLKTKWKESMYKQNINNPPKHLSQTILGISSSTQNLENSITTIKNAFSLFVLPNLQSATAWEYQSLWTSNELSQSSSFSILGCFNLIQVLIRTSPRERTHSFLCCACSKSLDHTICGWLPMATDSLTLKTKVLSDFGKYVFY